MSTNNDHLLTDKQLAADTCAILGWLTLQLVVVTISIGLTSRDKHDATRSATRTCNGLVDVGEGELCRGITETRCFKRIAVRPPRFDLRGAHTAVNREEERRECVLRLKSTVSILHHT